jgi:formylglycine-generating enzyme required for sulfatase activity
MRQVEFRVGSLLGMMLSVGCLASVQPCPGDIDGDRNVGGADLAAVLAGWGQCASGASCVADVNSDGTVDAADLTVLLSAWGSCPVTVPSWATLVEALPDSAVVTSPTLRAAIASSGYAWRVRDAATQIEMVLIPPGSFRMGCSASNLWSCAAPESPVHDVTLTQPFYLGRYEVTQAQWLDVMGSPAGFFVAGNGYPGSDSRPVESVSWSAIQEFLAQSGMRLPTEAQWEFAYRAGTTRAFHGAPGFADGTTNDFLLREIAWSTSNSGQRTFPVGQKAGNGFGLHDMSGNVCEWVSDWFGADYYASSPSVDPSGPASGSLRLLRGGSCIAGSGACRASGRNPVDPSMDLLIDAGFRVARNP